MAIINDIILLSEGTLAEWKFASVENAMKERGLGAGVHALLSIAVFFTLISTCAVVLIAPPCAGSGLPEIKGYLNGNNIHDLFTVNTLVVRIFALVFSVASGMPIGREGPMVSIGCCLGYGITHKLALPFVRTWVKTGISANDDECSPALLVDTQRFAAAKRIGSALGGAAGVAVAFNAPIGGILYMFEEVTVESWPPELTVKTFACTVVAALASQQSLTLVGSEVHTVGNFNRSRQNEKAYGVIDLIFFVFVAACLGVFSAILTRVMLAVFSMRQRWNKYMSVCQPYAKILDVVVFVVVCSLAWALVPLLVDCESDKNFNRGIGNETKNGVTYNCPSGTSNRVAEIFLSGWEGTLVRLLDRDNAGEISVTSLAIAMVVYGTLVCGGPGLPVPMGMFVPSLLLGGLGGRIAGEVLSHIPLQLAPPGVYALCGCAAMLSGFTHMTIAIVVLLVEASLDLLLVPPLILSCFTSHIVSTLMNKHGYDEVLILKKGVPFLDAVPPPEMDADGKSAIDVCDLLPSAALLPSEADLLRVAKSFRRCQDVSEFPVIDDNGCCIGLVPRTRLYAALEARSLALVEEGVIQAANAPHLIALQADGDSDVKEHAEPTGRTRARSMSSDDDVTSDMDGAIRRMYTTRRGVSRDSRQKISLYRIMDRSPYLLLEDMPVARFYSLFTKSGAESACVVANNGQFRGLVTRESLISSTRDEFRPQAIRRTCIMQTSHLERKQTAAKGTLLAAQTFLSDVAEVDEDGEESEDNATVVMNFED
eukprot:TRINITY_DN68541_c0_g1_i1.p1 TRINITY_DN68541_c0_g1~~TRINITY_DN68541_c0_g1_i1.p1  ORF type:complete len:861 (+),score=134.55 TRINITY_DN68541_c0_g1_i1:286-2583(+)